MNFFCKIKEIVAEILRLLLERENDYHFNSLQVRLLNHFHKKGDYGLCARLIIKAM